MLTTWILRSLFPQKKPVLRGVVSVTSSKYGDSYEFRAIKPVNILEEHRPTKALWVKSTYSLLLSDIVLSRLLKCASHPDNTSIKSPRAGMINVAIANPSTLSIHTTSGYLWSNRTNSWVMSTLMGKTTYFPTSNYRQICITPFTHGWYRFTSVLAEVCGHDTLHFQTFMGGVTFGTSTYQTRGNISGISTEGKEKKGEITPVKGSMIGSQDESTYLVPLHVLWKT
jgi:hypothetical protein